MVRIGDGRPFRGVGVRRARKSCQWHDFSAERAEPRVFNSPMPRRIAACNGEGNGGVEPHPTACLNVPETVPPMPLLAEAAVPKATKAAAVRMGLSMMSSCQFVTRDTGAGANRVTFRRAGMGWGVGRVRDVTHHCTERVGV